MSAEFFFFFNHPSTTEIYTLSLHDALPISGDRGHRLRDRAEERQPDRPVGRQHEPGWRILPAAEHRGRDRKSTRLNSSHTVISYAVFCLKKKKKTERITSTHTESKH